MDIEQLQELGFQVERIATLLGIDDLAAPDAVERIAKMALKIEHYYRLMNNPLDPRSRLLKVVDNIVNYSSVDLLPPAQVRKREPLELQLFRSYCETVRMPERVSRDIIEYIGKLVDLFNPASSAINEITESI